MSQASLTIADGTGAAVLAALNAAFGALGSYFYGATDPSTAGQAIAEICSSNKEMLPIPPG